MQLRQVKMFVTFYQKKFSNIDQKKHIIMEKKVPSPQVFLLLLILSILRKTFFSKKTKNEKKTHSSAGPVFLLFLCRTEKSILL